LPHVRTSRRCCLALFQVRRASRSCSRPRRGSIAWPGPFILRDDFGYLRIVTQGAAKGNENYGRLSLVCFFVTTTAASPVSSQACNYYGDQANQSTNYRSTKRRLQMLCDSGSGLTPQRVDKPLWRNHRDK